MEILLNTLFISNRVQKMLVLLLMGDRCTKKTFHEFYGSNSHWRGSSFLDGSGEYKHYITSLIKDVINEVRVENVVQIITNNVVALKAAGMFIKASLPHIFWTSCVIHTLNIALKNICAARNTK